MSGNIDFRKDTNTSQTSVLDDVLDVVLGHKSNELFVYLSVSLRIRVSGFPEVRIVVSLNHKGLVVCDVPVHHVELGVGETVDNTLDSRDREEVTGGIDEKTTVREEGRVLDGPGQVLDHVVLLRSVEEDQLAQGLEIGERDEMRTSRA